MTALAVVNTQNRRRASAQELRGERMARDGMLAWGWDVGDEGAGIGP